MRCRFSGSHRPERDFRTRTGSAPGAERRCGGTVLWPAGSGEVAVTTGSACGWTAASESEFLTVTGGASGTGSGMVTYAVAANAGGPRTGTLLVADSE